MLGDTKKKVIIELLLDDKASAKLQETYKKVESSSKVFLGTVVGLGAAMGALVTKSTLTAARTETLGVAMEAVAKSTGTSIDMLREQEAALKKQGITTQESRSMLTKFMQSQLDVAQATDLARVAQDLAVISGENSSATVQRLTDAIATQNPMLLREVGIVKNLEEVFTAYAKTLGKSWKELTELEKKQAMVNLILKEGKKVAGSYEAAMDTAGKKLGSLARYVEEAYNAIGQYFLPAFGKLVDAATEFLKKVTPENVEAVFKKFVEWLPVITTAIIFGLAPSLGTMALGLISTLAHLLPFIAIGAAVGLVLKELGLDFSKLGDYVKIAKEKLDVLRESFEKVKEVISVVMSLLKGESVGTDTLLKIFPEGGEGEKWLDIIYQVRDAFLEIKDAVYPIVEKLYLMLPTSQDLLTLWEGFVGWLKDFFSPENISLAIENLVTGMRDLWGWVNKTWESLKKFWEETLQPLFDFWWTMIKKYVLPEWEKLKDSVGELFALFFGDGEITKEILKAIVQIVGVLFAIAVTAAIVLVGAFINILRIVVDYMVSLRERSKEAWENLIDGLAKAINKFRDIVWWVQKVIDKIQSIPKSIGINFAGSSGGSFPTGGVTSGGWTMVGERGAELVNLPRGSHVYNKEDSQRMMGGGGITINVNAPVTGVDNLRATILEAVNEATERQNRLANYNLL